MKRIIEYFAKHKNFIHLILIAGVILLCVHIYNLFQYKYISIEFQELRPTHEKIYIYYKGIKVGHVRKIELCQDCKSSMAKSVLTYRNLMLPINTTAKLKKEKKHKKEYDFIELIYPEKPSNVLISNGAVLQGKATVDIDTFMKNQDSDDLETIRRNIAQSTEELEVVLSSLGDLFVILQDVVKENENNIYISTKNLSGATGNLNQITRKFDRAIKQQALDSSVSNIDKTLSNITQTTKTLDSLTGNFNNTSNSINKETMPQVQSTLYKTECLVANLNEITCGVKNTLKKRFGCIRLMFGKVIDSDNVNSGCSDCCE